MSPYLPIKHFFWRHVCVNYHKFGLTTVYRKLVKINTSDAQMAPYQEKNNWDFFPTLEFMNIVKTHFKSVFIPIRGEKCSLSIWSGWEKKSAMKDMFSWSRCIRKHPRLFRDKRGRGFRSLTRRYESRGE